MPNSDKWPWSAYTPGEPAPVRAHTSASPSEPPSNRRRRRPPHPDEQARREGWGKRWGGAIGEFWRQVHESEA